MADQLPVNNFTAGELAPTLAARIDLAKFSQGCSRLENFTVNPHGGAVKRPGFILLDRLPSEALLIPFVFNQTQAYSLAFLDNKLRVFTRSGVILKDGEPYEIDSPYTLAQAKTLSFVQSADTLFLACWEVPPTKLVRRAHDDWTFETMTFGPPIEAPTWALMQVSPGNRFTTYENKKLTQGDWLNPYVGEYTSFSVTARDHDFQGDVTGSIYAIGDVAYVIAQNPNWQNQVTNYYGARFVNGAVKSDGSGSPAQLTTPLSYHVTAVDSEERESQLSAAAVVSGPAANNWQGGDYVVLAWNSVPGASYYRVYKAEYYGRPGFIGSTTANSWVDHNVAASISEGAPSYVEPFPEGGGWPGVVGIFEQRLVFASTPASPQTIWFSKSGDYRNFAVYDPLMDDSSIQLTVASSEMSGFAWLSALRSMIIGTASMEWEISSTQGAFTVKTAKATPQSYIGSSKLPPILVGNALLHVTGAGNTVRNLKYDFGSDSYGGTDLSILANHLFAENGIVDWCYQKHPDSIIWCVGEDGGLYGLTYMEDHQIAAWHRHSTGGRFLSVCSVSGGHSDDLFVVVERGGAHYVEIQAPRPVADDVRAVFLDSALIYEGPPVSALSGLDHLEGREVGFLADGAVLGRRVVADGRVELEGPASVVVVGLPYESILESNPIELSPGQGNTLGRKKVVNAVAVEFHRTMGAFIGVSGFDSYEYKWRSDEPYGEAPRPFTGQRRVPVPSTAETTVRVRLTHGYPTPAHVLALIPEVAVN